MPLLDTCKFEEVVIKTEGAMPEQCLLRYVFFYHSRASNSKKMCLIWLKFELVLVIRNLIKLQWKIKLLYLGQHLPHYKSKEKIPSLKGE